MNHITFQRDYPGVQTVLQEIVYPVFGASDVLQEDIIAGNNLQEQANAAGISGIMRIAEYNLADNTPLNIFNVEIRDTVQLVRNRVGIKNLLLRLSDVFSTGLIFFHNEDPHKEWRISYFEKKESNSAVSTTKRYTYLCGANHGCRTVAERFSALIAQEKTPKTLLNAFSVEALNKEFYSEIAQWYYALCGIDKSQSEFLYLPHIAFDSDAGKLEYQQFGIRLIGRLLFCWFLKHKFSRTGKSLISEKILPNVSETQTLPDDFYHKRLAPLFFGCLNTPMPERSDYLGISLNDNPEWMSIPFLNGGLFAPQPGDCAEPHFRNTLKVDNGHLQKMFQILSRYNFTIDENDPDEIALAIDPEMLGQIFENLLASITPETGSTDMRKKTGSYYTPRVIVDYMTTQSLLVHLESKTGIAQDRLKTLFEDAAVEFSPREKQRIAEAVYSMTVLDPACGSGAFPMGMMNTGLKVLRQIDPDASCAKRLLGQSYSLSDETPEYIHKLALIANSIYGVDIQPFAVEIAKLRAFLSLIVDDTIKEDAPNRGIRALPNLDFKFVAANTLIPLPTLKASQPAADPNPSLFDVDDEEKKAQEQFFQNFEHLAEEYFSASLPTEKQNCRKSLMQLIEQKTHDNFTRIQSLYATLSPNHKKNLNKKEELEKVFLAREMALLDTYKNIFTHQTVDFFEPRYFFPKIKDGFDIVIGNPPYVRADNQDESYQEQRKAILASRIYETLWEKWDLYVAFLERCYKLLTPGGIEAFIVSDAYCHAKYAIKSQEWFLKNALIPRIDFCGEIKVFDAAVHNVIPFYIKADGTNSIPLRRLHVETFGNVTELPSQPQKDLTCRAFFPDAGHENETFSIPCLPLEAICYISVGMVVHANERIAKGAFGISDLISETKDKIHSKLFVEGKDLEAWFFPTHSFLEWNTERAPSQFRRPTFSELYNHDEKIMLPMVGDIRAAYDDKRVLCNHGVFVCIPWNMLNGVRNRSIKKSAVYRDEKNNETNIPSREEFEKNSEHFAIKYLLGICNSSVAKQYLRANRRNNVQLYPDDWKQLPIPIATPEQQRPIIKLVDEILVRKYADPTADITKLEHKLNMRISTLYGFTELEH